MIFICVTNRDRTILMWFGNEMSSEYFLRNNKELVNYSSGKKMKEILEN